MSSKPTIDIIPQGAIIQSFGVGPNDTNIVQGFPDPELYKTHNAPYFGETIGRYANRIKGATFEANGGQTYTLAANNGAHSLHGGNEGWGKKDFTGPEPIGLREVPGIETNGWSALEGGETVKYTYRSAHLEEGFPGTVDFTVAYTSGTQTNAEGKVATILSMEYEAVLVEDDSGVEETVVNLTNHSYFNLNPSARPVNVSGTSVALHSTSHLVLSFPDGIPTSTTPTPFPGLVPSTPFTFTSSRPFVDDCFVLDAPLPSPFPIDTRSQPLNCHVSASHPDTKLNLEVLSTEPSFQFYSGVFIQVPEVNGVDARWPFAGFCVEPGRYVNAVNVPEWREQVLLKKGETYGARIVYRGWSDETA